MHDKKSETPERADEAPIRERRRWLFFGLPLSFTTYALNRKKLTVRTGLLTTNEDDILLYRVMDTSLRRTLGQKIFGLGSIHVASSDQSSPELVIKNIRHPRDFKDELDERVEAERLRMRVRSGEIYGGDAHDHDHDCLDDHDHMDMPL